MSTPDSQTATPADAKPQPDVRSGFARKLLIAMLMAGAVFAGLAIYSDLGKLTESVRQFSWSALVLALLLVCANYLFRIARWQYYLKHLNIHVPLGESAEVFLAGFVMSVTPGKLGEVLKSLMLYESKGISVATTAPIVVAERLTDLVALVILSAVGALAFEHGMAFAVTGGVLVTGLVAVCAYEPLGSFALRVADVIPLMKRLGPKLHEAHRALLVMTRPMPLFVGTTAGLIGWAMECAALDCIVHGFPGVRLPWDAGVFTYASSTIAGAVAMMPGGLGVTDVGMALLLQKLGGPSMTASVATASTILIRIATLWFGVGVGAIAFASYKLRRR